MPVNIIVAALMSVNGTDDALSERYEMPSYRRCELYFLRSGILAVASLQIHHLCNGIHLRGLFRPASSAKIASVRSC